MTGTHETRLATVLVVGVFYADSVALHVAEALEDLGHPTMRFEVGPSLQPTAGTLRKRYEQVRRRIADMSGSIEVVRRRFTRRLLGAARGRSVGLTVVCHDFLQPKEVALLREATGAPVALWYPDHIGGFGKAWFLNAPYDGLFFKDPYIVHVLRRNLDKPIYYLPEAFSPRRHRVDRLREEDRLVFGCDIATASNLHAYRAAFFARLGDYEVKLWGNPPPLWMDVGSVAAMIGGRYVVHEDKARAFLAAKIVINNLYPAEIWGINARAFEIAGIGGFQLIDWRPGLGQLFEDGTELVSFYSMTDLRGKIDYYLQQPGHRAEIARRGRARAMRDHTFGSRLALLRDTLLGSAEGFPMPRIEMVAAGEGVR